MARALISVPEAAELIGVSPATAYRMVDAGQLSVIKLGGDGRMRIVRTKLLAQFGIADEAAA